jgi:hypothetical protein
MSSELDNSGVKQLTKLERDQIPVWQPELDGIIILNSDTRKLEHLVNRVWQPFSGVQAFLDLIDTPSQFTGSENKYVRVNASGNGIEFTGIAVGTDSTWSELIGDNANTEFTSTHDLDVRYVQVSVYNTITGHKVTTGVDTPAVNTVVTAFSAPPATNEYIVVITK